MSDFPTEIAYLLAYATCSAVYLAMNKCEFKRSPEKGERYKTLPIAYKLCCRFIVIPLFAGSFWINWLFIPAVAGFVALEVACVRWYKKVGLQ